MKQFLLILVLSVAVLIGFTSTRRISFYTKENTISLNDTLPQTDTLHTIDTFGGIKNMNDTNLKPKKDSLLK